MICNAIEPVQTPPQIVLNPRNAEVTVGQSVEFSCNVTGFPLPDIVWLRNGVKVQVTGNFLNPNLTIIATTVQLSTNPELVVGTLSIEQVDVTDAGNYSCLATNNLTNILNDTSVEALLSVQCKLQHIYIHIYRIYIIW